MNRTICIFCETWESGGIESFLHNVLLHMDLTGLDIDLVVERQGESVFTQKLLDSGINFIALSGSTRKLRQNYQMFRRLLAERRYDVLHLNIFQGMSLYYAKLAKQAGVPVRIAHSHGAYLRESATRPIKLFLHSLYREKYAGYSNQFWACSSVAAAFLFPAEIVTPYNYQHIPNGIETTDFRYSPAARAKARNELGLSDELLVGHVGRLQNQKNQSFLLDVFAALLNIDPSARLLLVGDGEDRAMLEKRAKGLMISDRVIFYGVSNHVEELLQAMDIFVFPSRNEGLGIAAVEAQAAGLPVLCSENVPEEANLTDLFSSLPLDAGAAKWADAIMDLQQKPKDKDRQNYADEVRKMRFEIRDVAGKIEGCYRGTSH